MVARAAAGIEYHPWARQTPWSSTYALALVASGAASGIGNIWRFPQPLAEGTGGTLLLLYAAFLLLLGAPLLLAELAWGRAQAQRPTTRAAPRPPMLPSALDAALSSWTLVAATTMLAVCLATGPRALAHVFGGPGAQAQASSFGALGAFVGACVAIALARPRIGIERASLVLLPTTFALVLAIAWTAVIACDPELRVLRSMLELRTDGIDAARVAQVAGYAMLSLGVGVGAIQACGARAAPAHGLGRVAAAVIAIDIVLAFTIDYALLAILHGTGSAPAAGGLLVFDRIPSAIMTLPVAGPLSAMFFGLVALAALSSAVLLLELAAQRLGRICGGRAASILLALAAAGGIAALMDAAERLVPGSLPRIDANLLYLVWPMGALGLALRAGWRWDRAALRSAMPELGARSALMLLWSLRITVPATLLLYVAARW